MLPQGTERTRTCKRQSGLGTTRSELCVRDASFRRSTRGGRDGDRGPQHDGFNGTITAGVGPFTVTRSGSISDTVISYGDLYPQASLRWNSGVNNFMIYGTGDIPVGDYSATQLANLGIGHGAVDGGVGYTYFDPTKGHEFSFVTGLTYNLTNPSTIIKTASTGISIGVPRNFCQNSSSWERSAISMTSSRPIADRLRSWVLSNPGSAASDRRLDLSFRWDRHRCSSV